MKVVLGQATVEGVAVVKSAASESICHSYSYKLCQMESDPLRMP